MKSFGIALFFCLQILTAYGQFMHPGMLHSGNDLAMLKERVRTEPYKTLWAELRNSAQAQLSWKPSPVDVIVVGFFSKPDIGASAFTRDGEAAYTMALQYAVTGEKAYAEKVIEILGAWSTTLDSVTDGNKKLLMGMIGIKYLNAAEIIKHTYKGWKTNDRKAFEKMVLGIWYPLIKDFMPGYNGNWDAAIAQTVMCIGIFMDRQDIFELAYRHISQGQSNGAINFYFNEWGQCQESGRDQGHTQMGLGFLTTVCEIAWKHGRDLYSAYDNRLALGYEYTAKYLLGEDVKYVKYTNFRGKQVFGDSISAVGRGRFSPIYERAYHHYNKRRKIDMPYTKRALEKSRPEKASSGFISWATLTTPNGADQ